MIVGWSKDGEEKSSEWRTKFPFPTKRDQRNPAFLDELTTICELWSNLHQDKVPQYILETPFSDTREDSPHLLVFAYRAHNFSNDNRRVLKFYRPSRKLRSFPVEELKARLKRLNSVYPADLLQHPHYRVVEYHSYESVGDYYYLEMEYVAGEDLLAKCRKEADGRLHFERASKWIARAARAIHQLHKGEIVHRDIKPSNIMITPCDCVVIVDLDLIRMEPSQDLQYFGGITQMDALVSTPQYLAPEVRFHAEEFSAKADQFSLGVSIYEIIAGKLPFKMKNGFPESYSPESLSGIPTGLWETIRRMMSEDPSRRFNSLSDAADALDRFQDRSTRVWFGVTQPTTPADSKNLLSIYPWFAATSQENLSREVNSSRKKTTLGIWGKSEVGISSMVSPAWERFPGKELKLSCPVRFRIDELPDGIANEVAVRPLSLASRIAILARAHTCLRGGEFKLSASDVLRIAETFKKVRLEQPSKESYAIAFEAVQALAILFRSVSNSMELSRNINNVAKSNQLRSLQIECLSTISHFPPEIALKFVSQLFWKEESEFAKQFATTDLKDKISSFGGLWEYVKDLRSRGEYPLIKEIVVTINSRSSIGGDDFFLQALREIDVVDFPGIRSSCKIDDLPTAICFAQSELSAFISVREYDVDQLAFVIDLKQIPKDEELECILAAIETSEEFNLKEPRIIANCQETLWEILEKDDSSTMRSEIAALREALRVNNSQLLFAQTKPVAAPTGAETKKVKLTRQNTNLLSNLKVDEKFEASTFFSLGELAHHETVSELWESLKPKLETKEIEEFIPRLKQVELAASKKLDSIEKSTWITEEQVTARSLKAWQKGLGQRIQSASDLKNKTEIIEETAFAIRSLIEVRLLATNDSSSQPNPKWPTVFDDEGRYFLELENFVEGIIQQVQSSTQRTIRTLNPIHLGCGDREMLAMAWGVYLQQTLLRRKTKENIREYIRELDQRFPSGLTDRKQRLLGVKIENLMLPKFRQDRHANEPPQQKVSRHLNLIVMPFYKVLHYLSMHPES